MIIPMTKYTFLLLSSEKEKFLRKLQELGVVDITRSEKAVDEASRKLMNEIESINNEIKCITNVSNALTESLRTKIFELKRELAEVSPWGEYDKEQVKFFDIKFYCTSPKTYKKEWEAEYAIQIIRETKEKLWFVVVGNSEGLPLKSIPMPANTASELETKIAECEAELEAEKKKLESRQTELSDLNKEKERLYAELNLYLAGVSGESAVEDSVVIYQGFAPSENGESLRKELDSMELYYSCAEARAEDNPPIKIRNNSFSKQFEPLTKMYGLPVYSEFDPTIFLSIFFLLFFAMCMGDLGYGLILIAIGLYLRGKEGGLANMWGLIMSLGFGTVVVGFIMGGFFGVSLTEVSWIPQWMKNCMITGSFNVGNATYDKWMVISLLVGVLHICLAMLTKAVWTVRREGLKHSLGTLGWTLLIVGGVIVIAVGLGGFMSAALMKWTLIGIAALSALGIFIFNRWGRNPLVNIGSGLWDTYNTASGLMSDLLSYIRLYALGLSGGMLGSTFNQIAEMVKGTDPTWQWIPFVLILIVGHVLNIALSCLGAFVHPLRLNFVEFFKNSGYEGMGVEYKPLKR